MKITSHPLQWYIDKLKNNEYFSIGMYGDGEWIGMFKERVNRANAEETIYTPELCKALEESMHFKSDNFYFSTPEGLKNAQHTGIGENKMDEWLKYRELDIEFIEKDCWNYWATHSLLGPFIKQLREMNVCIISNKALRGLHFLGYDKFIEIGYPNCYTDGSLDRAYEEAINYGKPGVYLIAAGLPATLLVQKLHNKIPNSWFLDLGSIWDAFVHIGGQRGWREELYKDKKKWIEWFDKSLNINL